MKQNIKNLPVLRMALLILLSACAFCAHSQITIGSGVEPVKGAILDLKSHVADGDYVTSSTGGLLLPRVKLVSTTSLLPFIPAGDQTAEVGANLKGLVVYNLTTTDGFAVGPYNWDGTQWVTFAGAGGTAYVGSSPVTVTGNSIGLIAGTANGQVLKWNGTAWQLATDTDTNTTYTGTAPITVSAANAISLNDAGVTTVKLADNAVNSAKIADGTVATVDLANLAVTTAKLADNSVTSAKIVDGTVANADLANNAVNSAKIQDGTVALADLAANSVNSDKIVNASIALADLADNSVNSAKIVNGSIVAADLNAMGATNGQVLKFNGTAWAPAADAQNLTNSTTNTINGTQVQRAALTGDVTAPANSNATTIANNAVTSAKIADGAVANADLANNAVNSAKIQDGTVALADLATNSVNSDKIVNGSIVALDIANTTITQAKMIGTSSTTGQVLTSTGAGAAPTWQTPKASVVTGQVVSAGSSAIAGARSFGTGTANQAVITAGRGVIEVMVTNPNGAGYVAMSAAAYNGAVTWGTFAGQSTFYFVVHAITDTTVAAGWTVAPY